jgi:hypothetical protein
MSPTASNATFGGFTSLESLISNLAAQGYQSANRRWLRPGDTLRWTLPVSLVEDTRGRKRRAQGVDGTLNRTEEARDWQTVARAGTRGPNHQLATLTDRSLFRSYAFLNPPPGMTAGEELGESRVLFSRTGHGSSSLSGVGTGTGLVRFVLHGE